MDDLLQEFVAETRETLEALSGEIVAWEADPADRARLDAIFRFVHTVKGSCGFLDLPRLARLSHAAEDVLAAVRDGKRGPDTSLVNAVLAIVDRIGEIVEAIDAGASLDDSSEDLLIAALAEDAVPVAVAAGVQVTVPQRAASRTIRLNVDLLDRMMSGMSDMVLARNELARRLRDEAMDPRIEASLERLSLTVAEMRDTVTRTRMQKIEALFSPIPRMVRDTAAEVGKTVALTMEGSDVELDREMLELLRDPLVHIIRNSIDHGIEPADARRAAGKREAGRLTVSARQSGNQILIEIVDDGRGIDVDRVAAKAVQAGLRSERDIAAMTLAAKTDLIFEPGLSSKDVATTISGRGVGMDVVRSNIEQIGGRIQLVNTPGQGLGITIHVPLTLSIISTIIVGVDGQQFALPRQTVEEIVTLRGDAVRIDSVGDSAIATVRGKRLPLVMLGRVLGLHAQAAATLAIVSTREGVFALGVDAVIDTEELVVKPAAPPVMATGLYAGQTLPDSGRPMLLLDGSGIAAAAGLSFARVTTVVEEVAAEVVAPPTPALLFDDLDGRRRAIPLSVVDRVETVPADAIRLSGGRMRLAIGGALVPLHLAADLPPGRDVAVLRLTDGETEIGYAIAEAVDIVALPRDIAPAAVGGVIAGVAMIDDEPVELIDAFALFGGEASPVAGAPLCLLQADGRGWMESFLRPALEAAGYRCVSSLAPGQMPAVALALDHAEPAMTVGAGVPVVRLRRQKAAAGTNDTSIYRYDRPGLMAAVADTLDRRIAR
jgi:two-component system chemotaxis sensor kinase CheA